MMGKLWLYSAAIVAVSLFLFAGSRSFTASSASLQASTPPNTSPSSDNAQSPQEAPQQRITAYTLREERYRKAHDLGRIHFRYLLLSFFYGLVVVWLILHWKVGPIYRSWAERVSSKRFIQATIFSPLLILTIGILELPTGIYRHWLSSRYGLSIQGWPSWFWDWIKMEFVTMIVATILIWVLYAIVRRSLRRWWLYFWIASLPIGLFLFFLTPLVVDPLFHKFLPLSQKDPALTIDLQKLVQRAGQDIPAERMFWMGAGAKTTTLNAYVTGFGASKRIVIWDTTIAKMSTPQIVFVTGHEMGHYVLKHIPKGLAVGAVMLLVTFYFGFKGASWVLAKWGTEWGIRGIDDFASLPVLLIVLSTITFAGSPIDSAISRYFEHQADQYGLEVTHGLTPDSGQVAAQAFQILGDVGLDDPNPNPVDVFMFYGHPPISERVKFSLSYEPWSSGQPPEFVK